MVLSTQTQGASRPGRRMTDTNRWVQSITAKPMGKTGSMRMFQPRSILGLQRDHISVFRMRSTIERRTLCSSREQRLEQDKPDVALSSKAMRKWHLCIIPLLLHKMGQVPSRVEHHTVLQKGEREEAHGTIRMEYRTVLQMLGRMICRTVLSQLNIMEEPQTIRMGCRTEEAQAIKLNYPSVLLWTNGMELCTELPPTNRMGFRTGLQ